MKIILKTLFTTIFVLSSLLFVNAVSAVCDRDCSYSGSCLPGMPGCSGRTEYYCDGPYKCKSVGQGCGCPFFCHCWAGWDCDWDTTTLGCSIDCGAACMTGQPKSSFCGAQGNPNFLCKNPYCSESLNCNWACSSIVNCAAGSGECCTGSCSGDKCLYSPSNSICVNKYGAGATCKADCTCYAPECGNGIVEPPEVCDPPESSSGESCQSCCSYRSCSGGQCVTNQNCASGIKKCDHLCTGWYCSGPDPSCPGSTCSSNADCCNCGDWSNVDCEISPCSSTQMKQTRTCNPSGCDTESRCVDDTYTSSWTDDVCGGNACSLEEMHQTATSEYNCLSTSRCVSDPSCDITPPTSDITSPDAGSWQKPDLVSTFSYSDSGGSGLDICQYKVVSSGTTTQDWTSAGSCSGDGPVDLVKTITVGSGQNCRNEGTNKCTVYVKAKDGMGNWGSEGSRSFSIDWTPPTVTFNSPAQGSWQTEDFAINISDSDGLSGLSNCQYKVVSSGTTTRDWTSRTCNSATSATITVGPTGDCRHQGSNKCRVWIRAADNAGNIREISRDFSIDYEAPSYSGQNQNATMIPPYEAIKLSVRWSDEVGLSTAILSTNETGTWQNKTVYDSPTGLSGTSAWSNFSWYNSSVPIGTIVGWRVYANDTPVNHWNVTPVTSFATFTIINVSTSVSLKPLSVYKGNMVNVIVGFSDPRFEPVKKVNITLYIDGTLWEDCLNLDDVYPDGEMNKDCSSFGGGCMFHNSTSGNFSVQAECEIPDWVNIGRCELMAKIIHHSSLVILREAKAEIYVEAGVSEPEPIQISPLQGIINLIKSFFQKLTGLFSFVG